MIKTLSFNKDILDHGTSYSTEAFNIMGLFITCLFAGAASNNCSWAESHGAKDIVRNATYKMLRELGLSTSDAAELRPLFRLFGFELSSSSRRMSQIPTATTSVARVSEYEVTKIYEILNTEMIIPMDNIDTYYNISRHEYSFDDSCCKVLKQLLDSPELVPFIDYYKENPILGYFENNGIRTNLTRHLKLSSSYMMTLKEIFTGSDA